MEKLYNGILLADDFCAEPNDAERIPYLMNPPEVIDITVGRQLFVDDFLIEETDFVPNAHRAIKYEGNPVLYPETEQENKLPVACPKSGGVWFDEKEKLFKMWYEAGWLGQMAYAVSEDGIHWNRPNLHIEEGTNLILPFDHSHGDKLTGDLKHLRADSTTVFIDDTCDPSERYKLFLRSPGPEYPGIVAVSDDGIHFRDFKFTSPVYDRSTMFYNPFRKKWVYSIRDGWSERSRTYRECDNYMEGATWEKEEAHHWLAADSLDKANPYIGYPPELYNVDCVGYESLMLGMFQIFYGPDNDVCQAAGVPKITELQPMFSRDGYHFSRVRKSIVQASMSEGAWDRGYIQSVGGVCIINGDELWIYYIGFEGDETELGKFWMYNGMYKKGATGIAKMRRDGFVSMDGAGKLLTRKLTCYGKKTLHINAQGAYKVRVLNAEGMILAESKTFSGDITNALVEFEQFDVSSLNGSIFRLCFEGEGKLYSFGLADDKGDFCGAHAAGIVSKF